nr:MAG TPA: hypothetical protein [Caudoviricetes sp.]
MISTVMKSYISLQALISSMLTSLQALLALYSRNHYLQ